MTRFVKFFLNGTLLTCVSLFMRGISVIFNVYLSNKIGADGMGLFSLISTVYGFALTIATSGINFATTKLISEAIGKKELTNKYNEIHTSKDTQTRAILGKCIAYALIFSTSASIALFMFSENIGTSLLRDARTVSSLRLLSLTLVPIALSSVLSGYFIAVRRVYKNAIIQLAEQFTKIFATIFLFTVGFANNLESSCLAIVAGGAIGEILSFIIQWLLYIIEKSDKKTTPLPLKEKRNISSALIKLALPIAFSAYLRSALITVEHLLIPIGLEKSGSGRDNALAAYGTVHSMVFPLVLFPSAILSSFAGLLVPEVSQSQAANEKDRIERIISRVIRASLIFSIGVSGILSSFAYELGSWVYPDSDAGRYIRMVAPLIPIMYIDSSIDAILKGLGQQVYSMFVNIADAFISVILVIFLLPRYGILGYIITVYFTETLNTTLSITRLLMISRTKPRIFSWVIKPLISVVGATFLTKALSSRFYIFLLSENVTLSVYISFSVILYILFLFLTRTVKLSHIKNYKGYIKHGFSSL